MGFTDEGNLTTEDQKTYYGLIKQWEDTGRTSAQAFDSIRGLSRILQKKWGTNVIDAITGSLRRLRTTPFTWTNSYHDGASGETVREIDMLNILSELKIVQTEHHGDGESAGEAAYSALGLTSEMTSGGGCRPGAASMRVLRPARRRRLLSLSGRSHLQPETWRPLRGRQPGVRLLPPQYLERNSGLRDQRDRWLTASCGLPWCGSARR